MSHRQRSYHIDVNDHDTMKTLPRQLGTLRDLRRLQRDPQPQHLVLRHHESLLIRVLFILLLATATHAPEHNISGATTTATATLIPIPEFDSTLTIPSNNSPLRKAANDSDNRFVTYRGPRLRSRLLHHPRLMSHRNTPRIQKHSSPLTLAMAEKLDADESNATTTQSTNSQRAPARHNNAIYGRACATIKSTSWHTNEPTRFHRARPQIQREASHTTHACMNTVSVYTR